MLKLFRSLTWLATFAAGLGLLVCTLGWFAARKDGMAASPRLEFYWTLSAAILAVSWSCRHWLGRLQAERNRTELAKVHAASTFEASGDPWLAFGILALLALFAAMAWFFSSTYKPGMATVSLCLLALFLFLGWGLVRLWLRPGPTLRMDASGIDHAMYGPIPWRDVVAMSLESVRIRHATQHTLFLCVRGPFRYMRNAPALTRWIHGRRLLRGTAFGALPIPLNALGKDPGLIHESALALRRRQDAPMLAHWHSRMESREVATWLDMEEATREAGRIADEVESAGSAPDPERMAALDERMREHMARHEALRPDIRAAIDASVKRTKRQVRNSWILLAAVVALVLLRVASKLA